MFWKEGSGAGGLLLFNKGQSVWGEGLFSGKKEFCGRFQDSAHKIIDIRIENRKIVSPKGAIRALEADVLELRWLSDEATQLHLHGYDKKLNLRPGKPGVMSFTAGATGRFPITSHGWGKHGRGHGHHALPHLEVYPR